MIPLLITAYRLLQAGLKTRLYQLSNSTPNSQLSTPNSQSPESGGPDLDLRYHLHV